MKPELETALVDYLRWVGRTFPDETVEEQMEHLIEEVKELRDNMLDPHEYADVFMLLICVAAKNGVNVFQAFYEKFEINKNRKWKKTAKGFRHK